MAIATVMILRSNRQRSGPTIGDRFHTLLDAAGRALAPLLSPFKRGRLKEADPR